jgi:hypothetical protein
MKHRTVRAAVVGALFVCLAVAAAVVSQRAPAAPRTRAAYPYESAAFTAFVKESYRDGGAKGEAARFYRWAEEAYARARVKPAGKERLTLPQVLDQDRQELAAVGDARGRAKVELREAGWLHRVVKAILPTFSLTRGFEFRHAVTYGERQCFLQSVLIAGMLQRIGAEAGVVMVFRNAAGAESNNGHAAVLLKLSDGGDVLVDASDPTPFMRHRGIMARTGHYRYLTPVYDGASTRIVSYRDVRATRPMPAAQVAPLDLAFVRSQFWYYRGERAAGGILSPHPTTVGLRASARYLEASVRACPGNPLAEYMLGRVYLKQGRTAQAERVLTKAQQHYAQYGWVPAGPKEYLALARQRRRG